PQALDERGVHAAVHEHTLAVRAHLARRVEISEQRARHGVIQSRILEHDERGLAAELEGYLLQRRGGIGHDGLAGTDLAGERDLADAGMTRQEPPGLRPALRHLEYPLGQSRSRKHLLKLDGRERSE